MKKISFFLALLALFLTTPAHADIIPKDMKPIYLSAMIENMGEYPDFTFIEIETLGDEVRSASIIGPDGRIAKGYKFNKLHLLAIPKDEFPDSTKLDWQALLKNKTIPRYAGVLAAGQELVPRDSPLSGRTTHYKIIGIENAQIRMEMVNVKELRVEPGVSIGQFNRAFLFTVCIELIAMLLIIRLGYRSKTPGVARIGFTVLLAQTATLPVLWYIITQFALTGATVFLAAEAFAIIVECAIYKPLLRMTWTGAILASLLCNALSVLIGMWV